MIKYLFIISLLLLGCTSSHQKAELEKIEETDIDTLTLHSVPDMELWCSDGMAICDSCLLIIDRCQDKKLFIYRLKDFECLANIGSVGQGPGDMVFPFFLHGNKAATLKEQTLYDVNLSRLKTIDIDALLHGSTNVIKQNVSLLSELSGSTDMVQMGDCYFGTKDLDQGLFFRYSSADSTMGWIPYPSSLLSIEDARQGNVNQSRMTAQVNEGLLAVAMRYYNQIFLYNAKGELLRGGTLGQKIEPIFENNQELSESSKIFFSHIYSTDNYIYLVTANQYYKDKRPSSRRSSDIIVLDWDLNHIKTFHANRRIQQLILDSIYHRLLVLCVNDEEAPELYYTDFEEDWFTKN